MPQPPAANISVSLLHQRKDIYREETDRQEMERQISPRRKQIFQDGKNHKRPKSDAWWADLTRFPHLGGEESLEKAYTETANSLRVAVGSKLHVVQNQRQSAQTASRKARPLCVTIPEPAP